MTSLLQTHSKYQLMPLRNAKQASGNQDNSWCMQDVVLTACRAYMDRAYLSVVWEVLQWLESASCVLLVGSPCPASGKADPCRPLCAEGDLE